jgi:hypothetical protein
MDACLGTCHRKCGLCKHTEFGLTFSWLQITEAFVIGCHQVRRVATLEDRLNRGFFHEPPAIRGISIIFAFPIKKSPSSFVL